jgi:hypothetical protein
MQETNYTSGMNNSFSQATPGAKAPPKAPSTAVNPPPAVPNATFSKPIQPAAAITAGPVTSTPAPVKPAQQSLPLNMKISLPEGFANNFANAAGSIGAAGANAYGKATSPWGALSGIKDYLGQPQNFANMMGALSPIASPVLQAGGLPLMLGAYSLLKDPSYFKDLSGGMLPKLGAVAPTAPKPPSIPDFRAPDILGSGTASGQVPLPAAIQSRPAQTTVQSTPPPKISTGDKVTAGLGAGGALSGMAASRMVGQGAGKLLGPAVDIGMDAANVLGLGRAIDGKDPLPWRQTAKEHGDSLNAANWLARYGHIRDNDELGPGGKALAFATHTVNNPLLAPVSQPISTSLATAKAVEDTGKSVGDILRMNQTSNKGLAPRIR